MALPLRPRLAEHVAARKHLVDGVPVVVLHDLGTGAMLQIGPREWEFLAVADGTRDHRGIQLAAEREGAVASAAILEAFFEGLEQAGLLADGPLAPPVPRSIDAHAPRFKVPIEALPSFSLHCDGRGTCCRLYGTVIFSPLEAARARALVPSVLLGGERHENAFLPARGAESRAGSAVALVNGACAYLGEDGGCSVHAAGGARAKPVGCRTFPASLVNDGATVRVAPRVECACVLASIGREGGAPLLDGDPKTGADLAPELFVADLPEIVRVTPLANETRRSLRAWADALLAAHPPRDPRAAFERLAIAVDEFGLAIGPSRAALADASRESSAKAQSSAEIDLRRALVAALGARAARRARSDASWRSPRDMTRVLTAWLDRACSALEGAGLEAALAFPTDAVRVREQFYFRVVLFGHWLGGDVPVVRALRDRAVRLLVARSLGRCFEQAETPVDAAIREPIACVEAILQGHGLSGYVSDA